MFDLLLYIWINISELFPLILHCKLHYYNNTFFNIIFLYAERTILLRNLKFCWIQKIILLDHQNNFVGILKITNNAAKNFDILTINLSVLHNYFDSSTKLLF